MPVNRPSGASASRRSSAAMRRTVRMLAAAACLGLLMLGQGSLRGTAQQPGGVVLVRGTVAVEPGMQSSVASALNEAQPLLHGAGYFAITDVRLEQGWALVSVLGLGALHGGGIWSIEDGVWAGLVLLEQVGPGQWAGSAQGTQLFESLVLQTPDAFLPPAAKHELAPRPAAAGATYSTFIFPWRTGYSMFYGNSGIHENGFNGVDGISGWKAVDMLSDGDTANGHAPNQLVASAPGTLTYKCKDANNVAVHIGNFFYTHLTDNPGLVTGTFFVQGAPLGQMKVGSFGSTGSGCGWARQSEGWFHVHWGFVNSDLAVDNWTLSMSTGNWTNGTDTVTPGAGWLNAQAVARVFDDLPVTGKEWMVPWINSFYYSGLTTGCATEPLTYCPEQNVTRAEMAVFLLRAIHGADYSPPPASHYFGDMPVTGKEWMQPWVDEYYREGLTSGCAADPLSFCPEQNVTRAEMAVFVLRATHAAGWQPPGSTGLFSDVPVSGQEWMQPWIEEYYREGITAGCSQSPLGYCPESPTTRAEMAVFLDRAFHLYP